MSAQSILNAISMDSIPKIKEVIANADSFAANQMEHRAHREMMNSPIRIVDMDSKQLDRFQNNLIEVFYHYNWLS